MYKRQQLSQIEVRGPGFMYLGMRGVGGSLGLGLEVHGHICNSLEEIDRPILPLAPVSSQGRFRFNEVFG